MTEDEIKKEISIYDKIIADNYADYCETLKDNGRTDTLIKTIEELEKVKKQLAIAVEALDLYKNLRGDGTLKNYESIAVKALKQIKELEK